VGIPVLHAESQYKKVGAWFRDTLPNSDKNELKRWVTDDFASPVLYEYENERELMNKKQNVKYYADYLAAGTGSLIYYGSYIYHRHSSNFLVRYGLENGDQVQSDQLGNISNVDCPRKLDQTFEVGRLWIVVVCEWFITNSPFRVAMRPTATHGSIIANRITSTSRWTRTVYGWSTRARDIPI